MLSPSGVVLATASLTINVLSNGKQPPPKQNFQLQIHDVGGSYQNSVAAPQGGGALSWPDHLLLGEDFALQVVPVNADGSRSSAIPSTVSISTQTPASPAVNSQLFSQPTVLFPNHVLIQFSQPSVANTTEFFPVHSGSATLSVSFQPNGASSPTTVNLAVQVDSSNFQLGSTHNDFDDLILQFADLRGIPPQILKAQIQQESGFDPKNYRYEPLTSDFKDISTRFVNTNGNLDIDGQFTPYCLPICLPSPDTASPADGSGLDAAELGLRQRFLVMTDSDGSPVFDFKVFTGLTQASPRQINATDGPISMENILLVNETKYHWISISPKNFFSYLDYRVSNRSFTAQTVLAASYGLTQILYTTAVQFIHFVDGNKIGRAPSALFDPRTSIDLGTEYLAGLFMRSFRNPNLAGAPTFSDTDEFERKFGVALERYNRGPWAQVHEDDLQGYATEVLTNSAQYEPVR